MQNNLDELKSRISNITNSGNVSLASKENNNSSMPAEMSPLSLSGMHRTETGIERSSPSSDIQYFGPTSTQYSANKAVQRISQSQALSTTCTSDTKGDPVETGTEINTLDGKEKNPTPCFPEAPHTKHLQKTEAIRLVHVYQHEIGQIYPLIDQSRLLRYMKESYLNNSIESSDTGVNDASAISCVALAIALSIERPDDTLRKTLFSYALAAVQFKSFSAGLNVTDIITVMLIVS